MSEHTHSVDRRTGGWLKSQLTAPNIIGLVMLIVSMVSWQRATEARNEMQDYRIKALEERQNSSEAIYMRRDISDQRLTGIEQKLEMMDKKIDAVRVAVR